jgi:hypothetical protein
MAIADESAPLLLSRQDYNPKSVSDGTLYEFVYRKSTRLLGFNATSGTTSGAGSFQTLQSINFSSGQIGKSGGLRIVAGGTITGTNGVKTVRLVLTDGAGTDHVFQEHATLVGFTGDWLYQATLFNVASEAVQRVVGSSLFDTSIVAFSVGLTADTSATSTATSTGAALKIAVKGQLANASDAITAHLLVVELIPSST